MCTQPRRIAAISVSERVSTQERRDCKSIKGLSSPVPKAANSSGSCPAHVDQGLKYMWGVLICCLLVVNRDLTPCHTMSLGGFRARTSNLHAVQCPLGPLNTAGYLLPLLRSSLCMARKVASETPTSGSAESLQKISPLSDRLPNDRSDDSCTVALEKCIYPFSNLLCNS